MFQSATIKLTGWYLLILMTISLIFSVAIYQLTSNEFGSRMQNLQNKIIVDASFTPVPLDTLWVTESAEASAHMILALLYANLIVLIGGGTWSYLLARRTLRPIEEAHEAQSRFTSDASHELRTPLASMKTELEVALRDPTSTKKDYKVILQSNLEEVEKLTQLSNMLLTLSRMEHHTLEHKPVNIDSVTRAVVKQLKLPAERVTISSVKQAKVAANEPAVRELITILIDNAIKYSPDNSVISIVISRRGGFISCALSNSGAGIADERLPHIFDRFYRADSSRSTHTQPGFGLGLSIANRIVELHNGELTVTSIPGGLTTFSVLLPIRKDSTDGLQ